MRRKLSPSIALDVGQSPMGAAPVGGGLREIRSVYERLSDGLNDLVQTLRSSLRRPGQPPLILELDHGTVRFDDPETFKFSLIPRTEFPAMRVARLVDWPAEELERVATNIRQVEKRFAEAVAETTVRLSSHIFTLVSGKHFYLTDEQGGNYLIRPGKNIIGRQAGCDVVIDPVYRGVSRKHLIIEPVSESFALVTDISSHGTYVPRQVF